MGPAPAPPMPVLARQPVDRSAARIVTPTATLNPVGAQAYVPDVASATGISAAIAAADTPLRSAPAAAPPPAVATISEAADSVLGSLLGSLLGPDPAAPVQAPLSWAVLAVARRTYGADSAAKVAADAALAAANADASGSVYFNQTPSLSYTLDPGQTSRGVVTGTLVGNDPDSSPLAYAVVSAPSRGSVAIASDGTFTYTPEASVAATGTVDTFTVSVSDAATGFHVHGVAGLLNLLSFGLFGDAGHTSTARVTVSVRPFPEEGSVPAGTAVVGSPDPTTGVVTGTVTPNDPTARLTYSGSTTTSKGSVVVNETTGAFTYTPTSGARHAAAKVGASTAVTTDSFTVTMTDGAGATSAVLVTVAISPKNTAPLAGTTTVGTPNASTGVVTGTVKATDADGDTLSYSGPSTTTKGSVTVNAGTGAFIYTPTVSARGSATGSTTDTFTVTVTDGYGGSTPIAVSVEVLPNASNPTTAKVTYVFDYTDGSEYWTPEAKAALQDSADEVASYLIVAQPVTLTFEVTALNDPGSDTMASAGSDLTSSRAGFFNTVVQNKILTGVDSNGNAVDGYIDVNFGTGYALGDTVGPDEYDFKSTMMHEMLHAYGFLSYTYEAGDNRDVYWTKFDKFIGTSSGARVISPNTYRFNTTYNTNLTGGAGGLFFLGPAAIEAYGGPVPLYTPSEWASGSSVSHLDDDTFTGSDMQLMNAMADSGLGIRTLSDVELGILTDLGYTVRQNPSAASVLFVGLIVLRRRRR